MGEYCGGFWGEEVNISKSSAVSHTETNIPCRLFFPVEAFFMTVIFCLLCGEVDIYYFFFSFCFRCWPNLAQ